MTKPRIAILITDGTNCDEETLAAFVLAGAKPSKIHINQLFKQPNILLRYQVFVIPGGFSYGDDILSAKILANQLLYRLYDAVSSFIEKDRLIFGICNGFQVLIRAGFLPWKMEPAHDCSLIYNESGHFECRWIRLKINQSPSIFTKDMENTVIELPVAHGEGKFIVRNTSIMSNLRTLQLIACQYADDSAHETLKYPANPNGSTDALAGLTDTTGKIMGMMPHPERAVFFTQLPHWTYLKEKYLREGKPIPKYGPGLKIFQNAVNYFK